MAKPAKRRGSLEGSRSSDWNFSGTSAFPEHEFRLTFGNARRRVADAFSTLSLGPVFSAFSVPGPFLNDHAHAELDDETNIVIN